VPPTDAGAPRVSIVIPTYQRRESLLRLLRALHAQTVAPDLFEVIVSIDGSDDGTREAVVGHAAPFRVRHVWHPQRGRSGARNAGVRLAVGDVLLFLDDDMEPTHSHVAAHLEAHLRAQRAGAALGVVGAAPIFVGPDAPPVVAYRAAGFARKLERLARLEGDLPFGEVYSGNFSVRRDRFVAAGSYDEAFQLYGHEDYELATRLGRAGVRFVFDAAAVARQHYTNDVRRLASNVAAEGQTAVLFALKAPEAAAELPLMAYASRSRRTRARLALLLALSRAFPGFPSRAIAWIERQERHATPADYPRLFARYNVLFDLLYWLGVERALRERGAARGRVPFRDVARRLAAARERAGDHAGDGAGAAVVSSR
jgi:GT2 family glycosyltransferase